MTFNFETLSTNLKATFDTTERYGEGRSEQEKVITLLEKIYIMKNNLESTITLCSYNHN